MSIWLSGLVLALNVAANVAGTALLKHAVVTGNAAMSAAGCACYALGAACFVHLVQTRDLAVLSVVTASLGLLATVAIGVVVFHESLSARQATGIAIALIGLALISLPKTS